MEKALLKEWVAKLAPAIKGTEGLKGFKSISVVQSAAKKTPDQQPDYVIEVQITSNSLAVTDAIDTVFERLQADLLPMRYKLTEKRMRIEDVQGVA